MKPVQLAATGVLFSCLAASAGTHLTYVDLVRRLTDLQALAILPDAGETTRQWSSYDRQSYYDPATDRYVNWDANGDGGGIIRMEGTHAVLAEMEGPGCLWRIWSAAPGAGHVRIYLDGASEPAVDLPFRDYFDGNHKPFTRPALVNIVSQGCNNYTPIPYQKSCKIVADTNWGAYYHFDYSTFPGGTKVPTFTRDLTQTEEEALDKADRILSRCGPAVIDGPHADADFNETLRGGGLLRKRLKGPAAIVGLRAKLEIPASTTDEKILREITIQIQWDGEAAPSVWAPLGDFFGTAPGMNFYRSFPCGLTRDGWWYANWYMPFAKSATVLVKNEGKNDCRLKFEISSVPIQGAVSQWARFHAKWHRDAFLPGRSDRKIDWPFLRTEGAGRFVGVALHVWNPRGGWWGEGDEKFFVDGEKFPSFFGTGSEDYFGYAWCNPSLFQNAYHNQTHNDGGNRRHISVNRWHVADQVPFQKSFEGDLEKYYANERPTLYDSVAYWYLQPGGVDPYPPVPLADRWGYYKQPKAIPGFLEGESLKILGQSGGNVQRQDMAGFGAEWNNDAQLWWTGAQPGDRLDLALPVAATGRYKLVLQLTRASDYGIVQLGLDDQDLGEPVDLYDPNVTTTGELNFGVHALSAGEHKLTVRVVGADEKAAKSYMFGLDYVRLIQAPQR